MNRILDFIISHILTPIKSRWQKIKHKKVWILISIGLVYFAGFFSILYPMASNVISLISSKTTISSYNQTVQKMDSSEINERLKKAEKYNTDIFKGIYNDGNEKALCGADDLMCYVEVPSVGIYLPVYYGCSDETLEKGAGYLENTSLPIGGKSTHSVISAHTGLPSAQMFTALDKAKKGEIFYIHVLNKVLAYKIDKIEAVTPDKTEELQIFKGKDYCTLLTCTPYGVNDHRLLVRGERVAYEPKAENASTAPSINTSANDGLDNEIRYNIIMIVLIIIVSVFIYTVACIWVLRNGKKRSGKYEKK